MPTIPPEFERYVVVLNSEIQVAGCGWQARYCVCRAENFYPVLAHQKFSYEVAKKVRDWKNEWLDTKLPLLRSTPATTYEVRVTSMEALAPGIRTASFLRGR